ncbi:MAG: hypothetical protein II936_01110 [Oscillospiraceae bacterium]|nr:hypothetical protein [Oscillospiraceae bacterium]
MTLFDQDKAMEMYTKEITRNTEIKTAVEVYQEVGTSFPDTIKIIAKKFGFTQDKSKDQVKAYWKGQIPTA